MARGDGWLAVRPNITHELPPPDAQCERKAMREEKNRRHNPHEAHTTASLHGCALSPNSSLSLSLSRTSERRNRWGTQPPLARILDANIALDRRRRAILPAATHAPWRRAISPMHPDASCWQDPDRYPCLVVVARVLMPAAGRSLVATTLLHVGVDNFLR
jgi:hypothetical protein